MGLQLHRKLTHLFYLLGLLFLSSNINALDISIDGVLDEKEWSEAREWTKYYESMPFSLAEPKHFQKVLIQEDEKGMYFGFINLQSKDSIRANKHERDDEMANADKCGLAIDFDGDGLTAYGFTVSAGGSISDGIYRNENDVNYDWDADWDSATSINNDGWTVEVENQNTRKKTYFKCNYSGAPNVQCSARGEAVAPELHVAAALIKLET